MKIPAIAVMAEVVSQVGSYPGHTTGCITLRFILADGEQTTGLCAPATGLLAARPTAVSTLCPWAPTAVP